MRTKNFLVILISLNIFWAGINFFILAGFDVRNFDFSAEFARSARAQASTTYSENWQALEGVYPTGFLSESAYSQGNYTSGSLPTYDIRDGISANEFSAYNFPRYARASSPATGQATVATHYDSVSNTSCCQSVLSGGPIYSSNRFFQPIKWSVSGEINSLPYTENWYVSASKYLIASYSQTYTPSSTSCSGSSWSCTKTASLSASSSIITASGGTFSNPAAPTSDTICGSAVNFYRYEYRYQGRSSSNSNYITDNQGGSMCSFVPTQWTIDGSFGGVQIREIWTVTAGAGDFGGCSSNPYDVRIGGGGGFSSTQSWATRTAYDPDCEFTPTQWAVSGQILP